MATESQVDALQQERRQQLTHSLPDDPAGTAMPSLSGAGLSGLQPIWALNQLKKASKLSFRIASEESGVRAIAVSPMSRAVSEIEVCFTRGE